MGIIEAYKYSRVTAPNYIIDGTYNWCEQGCCLLYCTDTGTIEGLILAE